MKPGVWHTVPLYKKYPAFDLFLRGLLFLVGIATAAAWTPFGFEVASSALGF